MITEMVLWKIPDGMTRQELLNKFRSTVPGWKANPNLIHKAFVFDEISRRGGGIYLWKNIVAAKEAHNSAFRDHVKSMYGSTPEFQYFDALVVIDNAANQVIDDAA